MRQHCDLCILLLLLLGLSATPSLQSSSSPTTEEDGGGDGRHGRGKESAHRPLNEAPDADGRNRNAADESVVAAEIEAESQPIVVNDPAQSTPSPDPALNGGHGPIMQHPYYTSHPIDARPGQEYQHYGPPLTMVLGDRQPIEPARLHQEQQQYYQHSEMQHRPTLSDLTVEEAAIVNTPEQLLKHCCQFPACYDPLYELCIDTCRKCETAFPVTSWLPCPALLNIPDCTSDSLSAAGRLPLACYPDIGPFANIMPISQVMRMSAAFNEPANRGGTAFDLAAQQEQSYRRSMKEANKKYCDKIGGNYGFGGGGGRERAGGGICRSEKTSAIAQRGGDTGLRGQFWRR